VVTTASHDATVAAARRAAATATDTTDLLVTTAAAVRRAVPHAAAAWLTTDPASGMFSHGHVEAFDAETCEPWFHAELVVDDVHKFSAIGDGRARLVSRLDDDERAGSWRWSQLMRPQGLDDELRIACRDGAATWATVELHREVGDPDFDTTVTALLQDVAPHLAAGVRRLSVVERADRAREPDAPGVVVVHPDGSITALTDAGARWSELLVPPSGSDRHTPVLAVAESARAVARGSRSAVEARVRTRTVDGAWVTLHAQPAVVEAEDVVVVVEPSQPAEIAMLLSHAYGLTTREHEVVLGLSRGSSTKQLAAELFLSPHTVRDHVKAAMAKVGVSSRGELVAALFERHYAPELFARVTTR